MGYRIEVVNSSFFISADQKSAAMEAVKVAFPKAKFYRDEGYHPIAIAASFQEAMNAAGWVVSGDTTTGDVVDIYGSGSDWAHDEDVFSVIAPFVREGSTIEMAGEDNRFYRWLFTAGGVVRQNGSVVYDE